MMANAISFLVARLRQLINLGLYPIVPASALILIAYGPPSVRSRIHALPIESQKLIYALRGLLGLGIGRTINRAMNSYAMNNWSMRSMSGWQWEGELAVVTGGCSGIGRALVEGLVRKGVRVAILDVQDLPMDLGKIDAVRYWKCDIVSSSEVHKAADEIRKQMGHPSILINNAGIGYAHSIIDTSEEELKRLLGINLLSLWTTTREFLPSMIIQNKGHIVTIASLASYVAMPRGVDYSVSKAGALAFHEGLASEIKHVYKAPGIMTTSVHPTWTRTGLTEKDAEAIEKTQGKMMSAEQVAARVLNQVFSRRGGQLIFPDSVSWISGFRGFPNWYQEMVRDGIGKGQ
jgi:all-trans-retinol dehydrogenase (NAD+)